jgi:hypothetical protein
MLRFDQLQWQTNDLVLSCECQEVILARAVEGNQFEVLFCWQT